MSKCWELIDRTGFYGILVSLNTDKKAPKQPKSTLNSKSRLDTDRAGGVYVVIGTEALRKKVNMIFDYTT